MGVFTFHRLKEFNLRKKSFIRKKKGVTFMKGIITLNVHKSLS